ncbi:MAG: TrmB family transcriptional regulator [Methanobrevibacter thaueri]|nr:TrmB family transcriptional regulator [Methanobrevibacter thaueri]
MDKNISTLKEIGLTKYEAQAYTTPTSLISSTVIEIAEKSNIPLSKIYDILDLKP